MGKRLRGGEPAAQKAALRGLGIPIAGEIVEPGRIEGGDVVWLDDRTVAVGRGYRTNDAGVAWIRDALPDSEVLAFDLPHLRGRSEVLHLMSLVSPLADDLVVAYPALLPVRLVELLESRGIEIVEVPDDELESMGPNVLALAPRVALALERNAETRKRLEGAGVEVLTYEGAELSKGDGGPTCLTRPLVRD
jgi:N-dimethylarginine dimethylaminohydrolase